MKQTKFNILHLSDIHLHDPAVSVNGTDPAIAEAFCIHDFSCDKIDMIAVTGDIFDGPYISTEMAIPKGPSNYGGFFFQKLQDILPDPSKTLFAYGNHDMKVRISKELDKNAGIMPVEAGKLREMIRFIINRPDHEAELAPFKAAFATFLASYKPKNKERITSVYDMAQAFAKFTGTCITDDKGPFSLTELEKMLFTNFDPYIKASQDSNRVAEKPFSYGVHYLEESNVIVARINTSWQNISSPYLDGWLSCGRQQVDQIAAQIQQIKDSHPGQELYVITLMHNAFNSLGYGDVHIPGDGTRSIALLISGFSDLILCGHEHGELPPSLMHFETYMLKTGGLMNNKSPRNSFSIIRLDFEKRELQRDLYIYNRENASFEITNSLHDNRGLYSKFELLPKKAREYIVDQSRDIEEYLQFFKDFNLEFSPDDTLSEEMAAILTGLMQSSAYSNHFFNRKEGIQRREYINELL